MLQFKDMRPRSKEKIQLIKSIFIIIVVMAIAIAVMGAYAAWYPSANPTPSKAAPLFPPATDNPFAH
jgi:uncharacterized membrane protein